MEYSGYWLGMAGTIAFAITAVLAVAPKRIDLFGVVVLGLITAVGGGTLRDLILDLPIFWIEDQSYLWVAIGASVAAFAAQGFFNKRSIFAGMLLLDGLGAALFAIQAVDKVWALDFGRPLVPIILGVVTAIGGGLIRDVLAGRPTLLMGRELYAIPVLFGCILYTVLLAYLPDEHTVTAIAAVAFIFALRAAAIRWNLREPDWLLTGPRQVDPEKPEA